MYASSGNFREGVRNFYSLRAYYSKQLWATRIVSRVLLEAHNGAQGTLRRSQAAYGGQWKPRPHRKRRTQYEPHLRETAGPHNAFKVLVWGLSSSALAEHKDRSKRRTKGTLYPTRAALCIKEGAMHSLNSGKELGVQDVLEER